METSVDLPAPLRPTSACDSPGRTVSPTSLRATVAPKCLLTPNASATGASVGSCEMVTGLSSLVSRGTPCAGRRTCGTAPGSALLAYLVAPERRVVDVVLRHQRRGELV